MYNDTICTHAKNEMCKYVIKRNAEQFILEDERPQL